MDEHTSRTALVPEAVAALGESLAADSRPLAWAHFLQKVAARNVCEIGVWEGEFAAAMLERAPAISRYYAVDPWAHLPGWNKPFNLGDRDLEHAYQQACSALAAWAEKVIIMRDIAATAVDRIPDSSLDFAYVDGDHTLRGVATDLIKLWPKIKDGGWLAGDDFNRDVWHHGPRYSPTLVYPFAAHFAEISGSPFFELPQNQFLIEKRSASGYAYFGMSSGRVAASPPVLDVAYPSGSNRHPRVSRKRALSKAMPKPLKSAAAKVLWTVANERMQERRERLTGCDDAQLFDKSGIAFIHIPKVAGSSISFALYGQQTRHATWYQLKRLNPVRFISWLKFAAVRDPVSRFVSAYDYLKAGGINEHDAAFGQSVLSQYASIDDFVHSLIDVGRTKALFEQIHFRPQYSYVCDRGGRCMVDRLVRLEHLNEDLATRIPEFPWSGSLPRFNATKGQRTDPGSLNPDSIEVLKSIYRRDWELCAAAARPSELYRRRVC